MSAATRAAAATVIASTMNDGVSLREALPRAVAKLPPEDHGLLRQLCYGTLRNYHRLSPVINARLRKPLKEKDGDVLAIMLSGLYQLMEMRTPDHAALSTSVEACRTLKKTWATGLVNGVLRNCTRQRDQLYADLTATQQLSHPAWLHRRITERWPEQAPEIFAANNMQPAMYLRVNQQQNSRESYLKKLHLAELEAHATEISPVAIRLDKGVDVSALPEFSSGAASVQDESAQLAAQLLNCQPDEIILDACSAPGGKTCHILEQQPQLQALIGWDIDSHRLTQVQENLERLQLGAQLAQVDATRPGSAYPAASFDRILVDAPCTGTGVIRRHPDIKLLRRDADIEPMAETQLDIVKALWPLLKPGGKLLYVTCSILPQENEEVIERLLAQTHLAVCEELPQSWGVACKYGRQILPTAEGPDGLYFCLLEKTDK